MVGKLIAIDDIPAFAEVKNIRPTHITDELRSAVKQLHEVDELEPFMRAILSDKSATPHGPAEIADILTHRISLEGSDGLAAFILKGRSFKTVRPKDISHQIYRLEKIDGLHFAALAASGIVLDGVREQFSSTCARLAVTYALIDCDDLARLLWAYGFLCPRDGSRIVGGRCHCGYAPSYSVLNVLQNDALAELRRARNLKQGRALVVLPPGSGKTRIAAQHAKACAAKDVLYIAHTHEILDVAYSEFSAAFDAGSVVRLQDPGAVPDAPVKLTTIQYLEKHLTDIDQIPFDYVVVDEFHHAAAKTYRAAINGLKYKFLLGLTATPFRGDRQDIVELCNGNVVVNYELRSGIEMGILAPYHYFGCFDDIDYRDLPLIAGRYNIRDLERKLIIKERHQAIVRKWKERADGKPSLAFCCSHKHAQKVAQAFLAQGVPAATYLSNTPPAERHRLAKKLRLGNMKVLCVVDVLNEGADMPFIECLLFVRPTESKRIFLQQLGRGLRRHVGKAHCIVIDFIGNFRNAYRVVEYHGLRPEDSDSSGPRLSRPGSAREMLDIPLGCTVSFEDRVLEVFAGQTLHPRNATRHNIGRILIYQYQRLSQQLGHDALPVEINRYSLLDMWFYRTVFGSWAKFQKLLKS